MKTQLAVLTLALSSTLLLSACGNDDDNNFFTDHGDDSNVNHAPTLVVTVKPVATDKVVKDVVVIESTGTDQDGDSLTYSLVTNTDGYYAIDASTGAVSLTDKGVALVAAGNTLSEIEVSVSDGTASVTKKATPSITSATTTTPNPSTDPNLTTFIANDARFGTLSAALSTVPGDTETTLGKDIEKLSDITFLAPTDEAINKTLDILATQMPELDTDSSGKVELAELLAKPALLKSMLQYHVLTSKVESSQVAANLNKNLATVNGLPLFVTQDGTDFVVPSQAIQLANAVATTANQTMQAKIDLQNVDIKIDNGIVHVIDQALIPPIYDIDETLVKLPETSVFREFLVIVGDDKGTIGSVATDKSATSYTVLAPNNATVNAKCVTLNPAALGYTGGVPIINDNNECVLAPLTSFGTAVNGFVPIPASIQADTKFSGEIGSITGTIVEANYIATNGVVHITDSLQ